jgi:exodeoxyribonuclease V gamma subunit
MTDYFEAFLSNRLEVLYQNLKDRLFGSLKAPFTRRLVIVYGPAMKSWLMLKMAEDPDLKVAMGIEFIYLNQAFETLCHTFQSHPHSHIPNQMELALAIEKELNQVLQNFGALSEAEKKIWFPLIHYLKLDLEELSESLKLSRKMERRLIGLSRQVSQHFREYGRYAHTLVSKWETQHHLGWQQQLWKTLFNNQSGWSYPCREFQQALAPDSYSEIHFFSISFIARSEFEFLGRLAEHMPVYYYLLSPCTMFWSDIRSDKESAYLQSFWQQKLGYSSKVAKLEELLRDRNALLANFGRLGREMASYIEENFMHTQASYILPSHVKELDPDLFINEDLFFTETDRPLTLLHAVQADMSVMRNPQGYLSVTVEADFSIQLHVTPNKQREIQILYHNLMRLIEKETSQLFPSDIIVMVPRVMDYVPYIQSIFGSKDSQLDFQIMDLGMQSHNEMVQGFLQLLALSDSRWDVTHLLQLFGHRAFQRRHQLTQSDYYIIQEWVEKAGIRWGEDLHHRNELLERHHCQKGMVEQTAVGTWDYGLTRLLLGLTTILKTESALCLDTLPYDNIDFSQGDLLGQWIRLLHSLRDDLMPLNDRTQMTLGDWVDYLTCLLENYFQADLTDLQSIEDYEDLKSQFEILRVSSKTFKESSFSFQSVKTHLTHLLEQRGITYKENHLQTVRFCSMMPLRSIPAKVIALIGMQEGDFPRAAHQSSLNLMAGQEQVDYCPNPTDLDRYLFLEALHSAQDYFLMSYQGYSYADSKELQPSLVIEELFSYLDKHYNVQGNKPSQCCIYRHPFDSFDESYFQQNSPLSNYSLADYRAAQMYYKGQKQLPHRFIEEFILTDQPEPEIASEATVIDLKQLMAVAKNPIKFHLNKVLDIYVQTEEDRQVKNEEEFFVSSLDKHILKQSAIKEPLEEVLLRAEKQGKMPLGLFKEVAFKDIEGEINEIHSRLQKHDLKPEDLFQIEFCTTCSEPTEIENGYWLLPAIPVIYSEGKKIQITGKLPYVTSKGLVIMSKGSLADVWKAWPNFLLYHYATLWHPNSLERQLILTHAAHPKKSFIDDPTPYLKQFLDYYYLCLNHFSPLLPEWLSLILEGDAKGLQDKMRSAFSDSFGEHRSQDLRWILHKDYLPNSEQMIAQWKAPTEALLADIIRHWYTGKHSNATGEI